MQNFINSFIKHRHMVLESLLNPLKAEKKPWEMLFIGFIYSSVALFLSLWIFEAQASLIAVFLCVLAAVPIMYRTIKLEERKDLIMTGERTLLKEHAKALSFFVFLFIGITLSFAMWYIFLPKDMVDNVFSVQAQTITQINAAASSQGAGQTFVKILLNNVRVLSFCILFSFLYGSGAIFILTWNASVIAAAIGIFIRNNLSRVAMEIGFNKIAAYFAVFSQGVGKYLFHGIPEIIAYFIAAMAGGIIGIAIIRKDFRTAKFENVLLDVSDLLLISLAVLFVAAAIEVFVTPIIF